MAISIDYFLFINTCFFSLGNFYHNQIGGGGEIHAFSSTASPPLAGCVARLYANFIYKTPARAIFDPLSTLYP